MGGSSQKGDNLGTVNIHFTNLYDILALFGLISLFFILCTGWFSRQIRRASTWFLYIFAWMFYSLSLLLILGHQAEDASKPRFPICLAQAMTLYANPVFVTTSTTAFLLQILLDMIYSLQGKIRSRRQLTMLFAVPFISWASILLEVFIFGLMHQSAVQRDVSGMFCHIVDPLPSLISGTIAMFTIIASLPINAAIGLTILRNKHTWRTLVSHEHSVSLLLRLILFQSTTLLGIGIVLAEYIPSKDENLPVLNTTLPLIPAIAGLVFGSQRDILCVWMFWRAPSSKMQPPTYETEFNP